DPSSERAFIVMEQLRGCTLDHLLLRYPQGLPWAEAREISLALLEALAYAHTQGVLHGDIKPGNLMLDDGNIRLFDFGLGRIVGDDEASVPILARSRFCAWTPRY
ncbi:protein kinase domain-containing protein, partial [Acinetobacter baumannii]|uniref:protein kinase domain-containing protein n=1 Tax=Acinetobacter baumannii TaxID=470 RepID=UPI0011C9BCE2